MRIIFFQGILYGPHYITRMFYRNKICDHHKAPLYNSYGKKIPVCGILLDKSKCVSTLFVKAPWKVS